MSSLQGDASLSLDQAPPLSIPASFFVTGPLFVVAAGALLMSQGAGTLASPWTPTTLALTHLGTFGFLAMVMMGALYQMAPVVAAAPVPGIRLAHLVHALAVIGGSALFLSLGGVWSLGAHWAFSMMAAALILFLLPVGWALLRVQAHQHTVHGMRMALASLLAVTLMGLLMGQGWGGSGFPGGRSLWIHVHLSVAFFGWIGGLLVAVSWQIIPMFYLARAPSIPAQRGLLAAIAGGVVIMLGALIAERAIGSDVASWIAFGGALIAGVAVWVWHPVQTWRCLAARRRKRVDGSVWFWQAGLVVAPIAGLLGVAAFLTDDPRPGMLMGWSVVWGWAGMVLHGMLTRIVPFLVWFHRFSAHVGMRPVPSLRRILPDRWTRQSWVAHVITLLLGWVAISTGSGSWLAAAGLGLVATGLLLLRSLVHVLRQRLDSAPDSALELGAQAKA